MTVQVIKTNSEIDYLVNVDTIIKFGDLIQITQIDTCYCIEKHEIKEIKVGM